MMVLITGGAKNGKSHHAERIFEHRAIEKFYIATMEPYGEDAQAAIARHQAMRARKGFTTIEKYHDIQEIELPQGCGVLVECMSTLCANEMFGGESETLQPHWSDPVSKIVKALEGFQKRASLVVVVTNDVGDDGMTYDEGTNAYIHMLSRLNCELVQRADCVMECVCGIPVLLKGDWPWES